MKRTELVKFLDDTLNLSDFATDCSNNGLQVEGVDEVTKIVFGVDASEALFDAAIDEDADFVFVHHGLSWGSEPRRFTGIVGKRLAMLLENGISLYAAHLPLDAHDKLGNNAVLADLINLQQRVPFCDYCQRKIAFAGVLNKSLSIRDIGAIYEDKLDTKAKIYGDKERKVSRIAICSGGGGLEALEEAAATGNELLITGEFDYTMYHPCLELDVPVVSLGHYASETTGVKAVMALLQNELALDCRFINIPTNL